MQAHTLKINAINIADKKKKHQLKNRLINKLTNFLIHEKK